MGVKRKRNMRIGFYLDAKEYELMLKKMQASGIQNRSAYIRKMVLDGYIIKKDYTVLKKAVYEIHKLGVNVNQVARIANTFDKADQEAVKDIQKRINQIWLLLMSGE